MTNREIDVLIAEKVFNLSVVDYDGVKVVWEGSTDNSSGVNKGLLPNYSTDISAAWQVVEAMNGKGFLISSTSLGTPCTIVIEENDVFGKTFTVESATAPEAICIAALKAIGIHIE